MSHCLSINGKPTFLLGVNYWSRAGGPRMWERFDEGAVKAELSQMARVGLNTCRSFAFIPTFMPQPPAVNGAAVDRMKRFFDLCQQGGMTTIPSALVGHMSGENYDFPGQAGRCTYTDPEVLSWQQSMMEAVAGAGADHAAVVAYLVSNEMPLWGGRSDPDKVLSWARAMREAMERRDHERPFGIGDGVMNLKGGQNGFDLRTLRPVIDIVGPHTYYTDCDPMRQALNAEYCIRSVTHFGLPVVFEEFGCSSVQVSEQNQARYYREVLHSCLGTGIAGALGWCFTDFDLLDDPPYSHHAFELGFGITRADGSEKPVCDELRKVHAFIDAVGYPDMEPPRPAAAIIVPSYFNTKYPFSWEDRDRMRRVLLQAYVLCAKAGLETELIPEGSDLSPYSLVLLPATQKLLSPTWRDLMAYVRGGGTVYWSYFSGDYSWHQGAWCHDFEALTGCRHQLRYGCYDLPDEDCRLHGPDIDLHTSTVVGDPYPRAYLPVDPVDADLLACDGRGHPALTVKKHGGGRVFFLNHPWEYYLSQQADVNETDSSHELYRMVARAAGATPEVACESEHGVVQARVARAPAGRLLWLVNHAWSEATAHVDTPGGAPIFGSGEPLGEGNVAVDLEPKQVVVYRLD